VRNADFAIFASRALEQKCGGTMPATLVRLAMGEMGEELVLASRRIHPTKLLAAGYPFRFPELEEAVRHEWEVMKMGLDAVPA
jgi:NAD dependent epimerase/dehydratase family enzyme